jgi:hypothetical protein
MPSFFKRGKRPPSDLETSDTPSHHAGEQSSTPTLLNQPIPTAVPAMDGTEKLDPTHYENGNRESVHTLQGTVTNDAEKYLTSPSSDVKPLPDDTDSHAAHLHADANEKQDRRVSTTQAEDEDAAGYLKGFPLYMAYLAMLLSIFLVSLDFTIM